MNARNENVETIEDVHAYLEKMVKNAEKHGIKIMFVSCWAPMIEWGCDAVTPFGKEHPERIIKSCAETGLKMIDLVEDD